MRRLLPPPQDGEPAGAQNLEDPLELAELYAYPERAEPGRPWLRANMISALDGAAHLSGRTEALSGPVDTRVLGVLRALADVVLVGAETVRSQGYRPVRARPAFAERRAALGQPPAAPIAVVSASLRLDFDAPLFTEPASRTLVLTTRQAPADAARRAERVARVLYVGEGERISPVEVVRALAEQGMTRLLHEGGPGLLGQFVAAELLDELCLTLSPQLVVGEAERVAHGPQPRMPERMRPELLLEDDGYLFGRYRRT